MFHLCIMEKLNNQTKFEWLLPDFHHNYNYITHHCETYQMSLMGFFKKHAWLLFAFPMDGFKNGLNTIFHLKKH